MIPPSLSQREKTLAVIVGGIVFIFFTGLLISLLGDWTHQLHISIQSKELQLRAMRKLTAQEGLWKRKNAWLESKQPKLENQDNAGLLLLNQIRDAAVKNQVALDHPAIDSLDFRGDYVSVSVQLETRSSWSSMLAFLHDLQSPERFVVIESSELKIDDRDHTQMHGQFKIAKWHSSGGSHAL